MKKLFSLVVAAFALTLASFGAHAAGAVTNGTIAAIKVQASGQVVVYMSAAIPGYPSCPGATTTRFVVDGTTASGRNILSNAQIALSLGKLVDYEGSGSCSIWSDTETGSSLAVKG